MLSIIVQRQKSMLPCWITQLTRRLRKLNQAQRSVFVLQGHLLYHKNRQLQSIRTRWVFKVNSLSIRLSMPCSWIMLTSHIKSVRQIFHVRQTQFSSSETWIVLRLWHRNKYSCATTMPMKSKRMIYSQTSLKQFERQKRPTDCMVVIKVAEIEMNTDSDCSASILATCIKNMLLNLVRWIQSRPTRISAVAILRLTSSVWRGTICLMHTIISVSELTSKACIWLNNTKLSYTRALATIQATKIVFCRCSDTEVTMRVI